MNIIFLDIDGVLNGYGFWNMLGWKISNIFHIQRLYKKYARDPFGIHKEKVKRLAKIIKKTNAKVVISSSWRIFWNVSYEEKMDSVKLLTDLFDIYNIEVIDTTPCLSSRRRDKEILSWLSKNEEKVDKFIILDDERSDLECFIGSNLIQTSSIKKGIIKGYWYENTGLKRRHINKAIRLLNKK